MKQLTIIILALSLALNALATPIATDSIASCEKFSARQLIVPGSLIAVGAVGVAWPQFPKWVNGRFDTFRGHRLTFDDWVQYAPAVAYAGLGAIPGINSRLDFKERVLAEATTYVFVAALTKGIKYCVNERRPMGGEGSFPSGHAAKAFAGAELIRMSYPAGVAAGAYVAATGVAFMRLYNNRHWINDLVAGAGVGILSARAAMWMMPLYRKWFHLSPRTGSAMALVPTPTGLSFAMVF